MEQHRKKIPATIPDEFLPRRKTISPLEKVALAAMEDPPYRASVDFYQVEYADGGPSVLKKPLYPAIALCSKTMS